MKPRFTDSGEKAKPSDGVEESPWTAKEIAAMHGALRSWFRHHARDLPWRTEKREPYAVFVSEMMLQQTQVATVVPFFTEWMKRFPTWQALASASETAVLRAWEGLGYYRRARGLHAAARKIVKVHGGRLPSDPEGLLALPGVGPYTAAAVGSLAFGLPMVAVDGNVARVLARLGDVRDPVDRTPGQKRIQQLATLLLPSDAPGIWNEGMIELGATVCDRVRPLCLLCPLQAWCRATDPVELPKRAPRPETTRREEDVVLCVRAGRIALVQRTQGMTWEGMWVLPEGAAAGPIAGQLEYSITRYRVLLRARTSDKVPAKVFWFSPAQLDKLPIASPHRRMLRLCGRHGGSV
jgi:A/G-specific adenine glycosylase